MPPPGLHAPSTQDLGYVLTGCAVLHNGLHMVRNIGSAACFLPPESIVQRKQLCCHAQHMLQTHAKSQSILDDSFRKVE